MGVGLFSPEASRPDPFIGTTLDGRYEVQASIGTGGVGVVYRGRHVQLGRAVAIKILPQGAATQPESRQRFEREAKALSVLAHPNIVTVTDSGVAQSTPYLVMELLLGKTLADLLAEGPLPTARAVDIARQVLRGLAFAHGKGIVHRDLKPANVFLQSLPDHADHVKLLDFGVAKFLDLSSSNENLTRVGTVFGTPAYMSPEQARGEVVDARTDVYAAGVILFELLTGRPPFRAPTVEGMRRANVSGPVASLAEARPGFAAAPFLQPIVERALASSSAGRFPDATSMLAALEATTAVSRVVGAASTGAPVTAGSASRGHGGAQPEDLSPLRRGWRWLSGSWRSAATLVSLFAGLTTVVTFVRHDAGKAHDAGPLPGVPVGGERSRSSPSELPSLPSPSPPPGARMARPAARDPWKAPVPAVLQAMRDKLTRGDHLTESTLRPVHAFARQNPADPRPWLLVAHTYARLDWLNDSVERYLHAYRLDPGCRGDPQMLSDLRRAAIHPAAARSAAKAIQDIFGAEALPDLARTGEIPSGHKSR